MSLPGPLEELAYLCCRIRRGHQRFTDEDRMDAKLLHALDVLWLLDAAFSDDHLPRGDQRNQLRREGRINLEGGEVAVVDADHVRTARQRHSQLRLGMHLD